MTQDPARPTRLFKYLDLSGAIKTLDTATVRFSSPLLFNDPFDTNLEEAFGTAYEEYHDGLKAAFYDMLREPMDYSALRDGPDSQKIRMMHGAMQRADVVLRETLRQQIMAMPIEELYPRRRTEEMTRHAVEQLRVGLARFGVFCAAPRSDDLLMWAHYAQKHEGAVIEFQPTTDSMFEAGKYVEYSDERPAMYRTPRDLLRRSYLMTPEASVREMLFALLFTKSPEWAYENEYPVAIPLSDRISADHMWTTLAFGASELATVFLGCRMSEGDCLRATELARRLNPKVQIMRARTHKREYALEFGAVD
jgi:hypothetical protein